MEKLSSLESKADILAAYRALEHIIIWSAGVALCFDKRPLADLEKRVKMALARGPARAEVRARRDLMRPLVEEAASQLPHIPPEKLPAKITKALMRDPEFRGQFPVNRRVVCSDVRAILFPNPEDEEEVDDE